MSSQNDDMVLLLCVTGGSHNYYFHQLLKHLHTKTILMKRRNSWRFSFRIWRTRPKKKLKQMVIWMIRVSEMKRNREYYFFHHFLYKWLRLLEASLLYVHYYCYFMEHPSVLVAIWNGNKFYGATAILAANAAGRKIVHFEGGLLPRTTTVDDKGINYANSLPQTTDFYLDWAKKNKRRLAASLPTTLIKRKFNKRKKITGKEKNLPVRYIFVPFQVNGDSQIFKHSSWISNMHHFYRILEHLCFSLQTTQIQLVIKEHPSCPMNYEDLHRAAAMNRRIMFANFNRTQQLIENAEAVITINSTVGLEALLLGKKVITLGDACYNLKDLVVHAKNERQLIQAVLDIPKWKPNQQLRKAFLAFVYHCYCIPDSWQNPTKRHWQAAGERLNRMAVNQNWLS